MSRVRMGLALAGFVVALISVVLNDRRIGWAAIALLAASTVARLLLRRREP